MSLNISSKSSNNATPRSSGQSTPTKRSSPMKGNRTGSRRSNLTASKPSVVMLGSDSRSNSSSESRSNSRQAQSRRKTAAPFHMDSDGVTPSLSISAPAQSFMKKDLWDMPDISHGSPSESLTWQQTLLKRHHKREDSAIDMSIDNANDASLTWQQQMLGSTKSKALTSPTKRKQNRGRTLYDSGKDSGSDSPSPAMASVNSKKSSRAGVKPSIDLSLQKMTLNEPFTIDDLFTSASGMSSTETETPSKPSSSAPTSQTPSPTKKKRAQRPKSAAVIPLQRSHSDHVISPTKSKARGKSQDDFALPSVSASTVLPSPSPAMMRYAGPDFHNSPSASTLPPPTFMKTFRPA